MTKIVPAILENDFSSIREKIFLIEDLVEWVQIDITDEVFTSRATWNKAEDLQEVGGKIKIEVHLMIDQPEKTIVKWLSVADRVLVHWEAMINPAFLIETMRNHSSKLGIVFNLDTNYEEAVDFLPEIDFIQLMGIDQIGSQGQVFSEKVLPRITEIKKKYPNTLVQIDGGINLATGKQCLTAGADLLAIGSAFWGQKDLKKALLEFNNL